MKREVYVPQKAVITRTL